MTPPPRVQPAEEAVTTDEAEEATNKERKHDSGAADLEKVTDFVEEKEITTQDIQQVGAYQRGPLEIKKPDQTVFLD